MKTLARYATVALAAALLVLIILPPLQPAHAAGMDIPPIPWLDDILAGLKADLVKVLQDLVKGIGVALWAVFKLCGAVGLLGADFSTLFGEVIVEAIDAVIGGDVATVIRGSLWLSIALFGLSLVAKPIWPNLQVVKFQRAVVWGIVIQAYLLNAPAIYDTLETFRVDLADQVASAVGGGSVPGCDGNTVETLLCIAGATPAEIVDPSIKTLPATLPPYGSSETIDEMYNHCVYNPPFYYGDTQCDPDDPQGDPWQVMGYAQDALGSQILGLILGLLALAYGVLQLALGLAAGMMFVLFPVAAIFAFYTPLESFPAGVIRNYLSIFLKSIVLLTLAAVVIRLFTVAAGNLPSLAAVGVIGLLLCGIMAKEALASLLSNVSFVGNSVSTIGAGFGLGGGGGGSASAYAPPESRMAAMMLGGGPTAQALMGAPNPYLMGMGRGGGMLGLPGSVARSAGSGLSSAFAEGSARQALSGALAGGGGIGLAAGAAVLGARAVAAGARQVLFPQGEQASLEVEMPAQASSDGSRPLVPELPTQAGGNTAATSLLSNIAPLQGESTDLDSWSPSSAQQIRSAAARLASAPPEVQQDACDLAEAGHDMAGRWTGAGRSPLLEDGRLDPQFVEETTQQNRLTAAAFLARQQQAGMAPEQRLGLQEAIALGVATQRTIPAQAVDRGLARAVKHMGRGGFETALRNEIGLGAAGAFGHRAEQAQKVARRMQGAGLANEGGRQLVEAVHDDLKHNPHLTAAGFRDRHYRRMGQWDRATGDPETTDRVVDDLAGLGPAQATTVCEIPTTQAPPSPSPAPDPEPDPVLAAQLRTWRREKAGRIGKRAFHVLPDATLQRIAARRPTTRKELAAIKGVGPVKMEQYAGDILDITRRQHEEEQA